jgi:hypothetical protein
VEEKSQIQDFIKENIATLCATKDIN